ncbi:MAG: WYL domain-containing protein, partial [Clostridia bacterium]|nr:WYL domain-containing protein [Clostridia bacterium]
KKGVFGMFTGDEEEVRFIVDKSMLDVVFDRFGKNIQLMQHDEDKYTFTANVQVSPIFMGWCCAFGEKIKVVAPESVVEQIKEHIKIISSAYD